MPTAILIDGEFFLKRYKSIFQIAELTEAHVGKTVSDLMGHCEDHYISSPGCDGKLYRIFYYDCPPLEKRVQLPVSLKGQNFSKTAGFRKHLHSELVKQRKIALRLGRLADNKRWIINPDKMKALLSQKIAITDLQDRDFQYDVRQKGVDMKIGLDIASLAFKKQVDRIVLFAGDSDFVPAAKLARREGIEFVLDPMWAGINPELLEHIDALHSCCPKPQSMIVE